jgi:hypothetical protein
MQTETQPQLPMNHVFVDFENVKKVDVEVIGRRNVTVHLFLGPENKKLDVGVVEKLVEHAQGVRMVRSPSAGPNALDFVLAYHLGQAVLAEPKACFHLVSGDTGFDSLVAFLEIRKVKIWRHKDWSTLTFQAPVKPVVSAAVVPKVEEVPAVVPAKKAAKKVAKKAAKKVATVAVKKIAKKVTVMPDLSDDAMNWGNALAKAASNRPKKEKKLLAHGVSYFGSNKPDSELRARKVIEEMKKEGVLSVDGKGAVTYFS